MLARSDNIIKTFIYTLCDKKIIFIHKYGEKFGNIVDVFLDNYSSMLIYEPLLDNIYFFSQTQNKKLELDDVILKDNYVFLKYLDKNIELSPDRYNKNFLISATEKLNKNPNINLTVRTLSKNFDIKVTKCLLFREFEMIICNHTGCPPDQQRLIYKGKHLNEQNFNNYNIQENDSISLVMKLRAGMMHETSGKNGNYTPLKDNILFVGLTNEEIQQINKLTN